MKHKKIKLITSLSILSFFLLMVLMTGCLKKNTDTYTDFSTLKDQVLLRKGGLVNFKAANLRVDAASADPDTVILYVDLASVNASNTPVTVKLGVDNSKIAEYNAATGTRYIPFTTNQFKLVDSVITIPAGEHYGQTLLILNQDQFDPLIAYLLPISILDASGKGLTSNQNTIYYNLIGNPIAGTYNWDFTRWNNADGSGTPNGASFTGGTASFIADDSTTIEVASGYFIGPKYVISFTNTNGVLSDFRVAFNADDLKTLDANGVSVIDGPTLLEADPIKKVYTVRYIVFNGSANRYLIDKYYK